MLLRFAILLLLLAIVNTPFYSQQKADGKTGVTLRDSLSGEAISNAGIMSLDGQKGTVSSEKGSFSLEIFGDGETLRISHLGYKVKYVPVSALKENPVILLSPKTLNENEVTVTAMRYKVQSTAFSEQVELTAADKLNHITVGDVLKTKTSLLIKDYGGFSGLKMVSSRGMTSENTAVLFNETRVNDLRTGIFDFSAVSPSSLERVEYIKGAEEGNVFSSPGGTVAMTTGNFSSSPAADITLKGGSDQLRSAAVSYKNSLNSFFYNFTAERTYSSNHFNYSFQKKNYERSNAHFSRTNLAGDFLLKSKNYLLKLYSGYNYLNGGIPGYVVSNNNVSSRALNISRSFLTILNGTYNPAQGIDLHANLSYNNQLLNISDPDNVLYYENNKKESQLTDLVYSIKAGYVISGLTLNAGFEGSRAQLKNFTSFIINPSVNAPISRDSYRLFSSGQYRFVQPLSILSAVTLNAAAGYDYLNENIKTNSKDKALSYSAGLSIIPDTKPYFNFKINAAKNVRFPTFNERYYSNIFTEYNLQKESYSWFDAGFESGMDIFGKTTLAVSYFSVSGRDKIIWVPTRLALQSPRNIQRVSSHGVEVNLGREIIKEVLKISGTYNYTDARNRTRLSERDMAYNKLLVYSPRNRFTFNLNLDINPVSFNVSGSYAGESFYTSDNDRNSVLPEYFTADCSLILKFKFLKKQNRISAAVYNILNEEYLVIQSYPMPLRTFLLTYNLEIF